MARKPINRAIITAPRILVFSEKYGDRYFQVNSDEDLFKACLKVFRERVKDGHWYWFPPEPAKPSMTVEAIAALPEGRVKKAAMFEISNYPQEVHTWKRAMENKEQYNKAMGGDGREAYYFLCSRVDHEYEHFNLHAADSLEEDSD